MEANPQLPNPRSFTYPAQYKLKKAQRTAKIVPSISTGSYTKFTPTLRNTTEAQFKIGETPSHSMDTGLLPIFASQRTVEAQPKARKVALQPTAPCALPSTLSQNVTELSPTPASDPDALQEIVEEDDSPPSRFAYPPPVPIPTFFLKDSGQRTEQCIKVLCGNAGILAERSIMIKSDKQASTKSNRIL